MANGHYNRITTEQIEILRAMNAGAHARLIRVGTKGQVVSDFRKDTSKSIEVPQMTLRWLKDGGFISHHKRESEKGKAVFAITSRGRNDAERDLRKPLTLTGVKLQTPVKDLVLMLVRRAGEKGITAKEINDTLISKYELQTHYKTIGMTLYRFSTEKLVRRQAKGNIWYAIPQRKRATKTTPKNAPAHVVPVVDPAAPVGGPVLH